MAVEPTRCLDDTARAIVAETTPREAEFFPRIARAVRKNPDRAFRGGGDDLLGFGLGDAVPLLTPIVLTVLTGVTTDTLTDVVKRHSGSLFSRWWARIRKGRTTAIPASDTELPPLAPEQVEEAAKAAEQIALSLKVDAETALRLRQALYGHLSGQR
ncbi:hypothetical protein [Streptosporangium sp. NBC_01756]|uniref:hypothetical protein n=1 Tax=Streptosporangium sp. NBC_01756 TaxID=2975950 RepID=UPI002DDA0D6C|nr:hypothetical protein [Streptosporangium sp. NBC_01756]WSC87341.1 hypothetical protein OIE48_03765 [Streptosporangium sp. NBC_01756]